MDGRLFYKRKLPHWQPNEETFFITYRLAGSLPTFLIRQLKAIYTVQKIQPDKLDSEKKELLRQKYFDAFNLELDKNLNEPHWLKNEKVASIVIQSLLFNNNKHYTLWCACLMSNHVHILLSTLPQSPLLNIILQNHKKFTAVQSNKILGRSGAFWAEESFDTLIRNNAHFFRAINYIIENPVKAALVRQWSDYKWTYIHPELRKEYVMQKQI